MRKITFTVDLPPRELSPNGYKHWRTVAAARREYRALVKLMATRVKRPSTFDPHMVSLTFCMKGVRKVIGAYGVRDIPNAISAWKPGFDALVDAGFFKDDRAEYMDLGSVTIDKTRGPFVMVEISE